MIHRKNVFSQKVIPLIATIFLLALIGSIMVWVSSRHNQEAEQKDDMLALVMVWARLAPFPPNAEAVSIKAEGNPFTRSFRASFTAPEGENETWICESPGLNETTPEETMNGKVHYTISPGGGANWAEVAIDKNSGRVDIYVAWS